MGYIYLNVAVNPKMVKFDGS